MGMEDRDYYWEDRARRDKLPHVTGNSYTRKTAFKKSVKPKKWRTVVSICVWAGLGSFIYVVIKLLAKHGYLQNMI